MTWPRLLQIDPRDNVCVALDPVAAGDAVGPDRAGRQDIPAGHKLALRRIGEGEPVPKYGWPIGQALRETSPGEYVHTHNLAAGLRGLETAERLLRLLLATASGQPARAEANGEREIALWKRGVTL